MGSPSWPRPDPVPSGTKDCWEGVVMEVTFSSGREQVRGYLAHPTGTGPWPGVIVIHDVFGLTNDLRRQCDWLASEGFLALGPDLYSRAGKFSCLRSIIMDLRARRGPTFDAIDAARIHLLSNGSCNGRVGIIGYCMGGGFSLLLAPDHRYAVSGVNYGDVPDDAEAVLKGACPGGGQLQAGEKTLTATPTAKKEH